MTTKKGSRIAATNIQILGWQTKLKKKQLTVITNNIHGCEKKRKACKPDTRGTPLRKKNQSTVNTNTPKKQENNLVKRIRMLMIGRG